MAAVRQFLSNLRIWPGPILAVDLITTSRRKRYFALRAFYAVALLFALYVAHSASLIGNTVEINDINAVARFTGAFFGEFAVVQLMAVLLIGPVMAAGTIAQERERRTIEYLYASPLSSMEIIVGKLGGRVMQLLYLVLGGVPVLSLAMLLGGIAPQLLIALTIITLSTILSVTMISIAVSIYTARARDAVIRAYLVFFVLLVMPLAAFTFLSTPYYAWMRPIHEQVVRANPIFTFMEIYTGQSPWIPAIEPWTMIGQLVRNQLLFAVLVLGRAAWVMRRIHLKQSATPVRKARRRGQWFRRPLGDNPMLWKEMYADGSASRVGMLGYVLLAVVLLVVCSITAYAYYESLHTNLGAYSRESGNVYCGYATCMAALLCCGGLLLVTARAAGSITSEKERDCWDSLISTPLDARDIVWGKFLGNFWALRGVLFTLAVIWLPALTLRPEFLVAIGFTLLIFAILVAFVAILGVNVSLRSKNSLRSLGTALAIGLFVGGGYLAFCCPLAEIGAHGSEQGLLVGLAPCMPFLVAVPGLFNAEVWSRDRSGTFIVAYVLGLIGYFFATVILYVWTVERFDELSERSVRRDYGEMKPRERPSL